MKAKRGRKPKRWSIHFFNTDHETKSRNPVITECKRDFGDALNECLEFACYNECATSFFITDENNKPKYMIEFDNDLKAQWMSL